MAIHFLAVAETSNGSNHKIMKDKNLTWMAKKPNIATLSFCNPVMIAFKLLLFFFFFNINQVIYLVCFDLRTSWMWGHYKTTQPYVYSARSEQNKSPLKESEIRSISNLVGSKRKILLKLSSKKKNMYVDSKSIRRNTLTIRSI